jgi:hypothetical protein
MKVRHGLMTSDLLLGGAAVATTAHQCTPVPEKGRYRLTTSGLRLTTSCSRWTKPGVCVRLTRMTVSESAADVGLPQKRKSGDVNDDPVLAARDGRTSGQKPESQDRAWCVDSPRLRTIRRSNAYVRGSERLMMSSFRAALASHLRTSPSCAPLIDAPISRGSKP